MSPLMYVLVTKTKSFSRANNSGQNILTAREAPGAQRHILNNTPVKFEEFFSSTFGDTGMHATNLDGHTDLSQKLSHF